MTELNLHGQPVKKPLKVDRTWTLTVPTQSRAELIHLSAFLAKAMESRFFHDYNDIPTIIIPGSGGGGKSMMVEAMMKALLDQCDPLDMLEPGARSEMFIEAQSCEACSHYCYAAGTTDGMPVAYGFDRITANSGDRSNSRLAATFKRAVENTSPRPNGGAIFSSNGRKDYKNPWLLIDLTTEGTGSDWSRTIKITVNSPKLKNSPQFQMQWDRLQYLVDNNCVAMLAEPAGGVSTKKTKLILDKNYIRQRNLDPELHLLKLAFKNPHEFGTTPREILKIVAQIADSGDIRRTRDFLSWMDQDDHDSFAEIAQMAKKGTVLKAALIGDHNIPGRVIYSYIGHSDQMMKIVRRFLSPAACAKKGSLYDSLFDALETKKNDRAITILRMAATLEPGDFKAFVTQKLSPDRHESTLLEYLFQGRRFDMLEHLSNNDGFSEIISQLLLPSACAQERSFYDVLFNALETKNRDTTRIIFRFAARLNTDDLMAFLTQKLYTERHDSTILESLDQRQILDLINILSDYSGFRDIFPRLLSPSSSARKGSVYDLLLNAVETGANDCAGFILRYAAHYLPSDNFKSLLTQIPCPDRHEFSLLECIFQNQNSYLIRQISEDYNCQRILFDLLSPSASAEKGSLYDILFDALKTGKHDRAYSILKIVSRLESDDFKAFLTQNPCPDRHESSLLEYAFQEGRQDILNILSYHYDFENIVSKLLSPSTSANKGSLYDILFDALKTKKDECAANICRYLLYLSRSDFKTFLTQKLCPDRHDSTLLEYICQERLDMLDFVSHNNGFSEIISSLLSPPASAQEGSLYDSLFNALKEKNDIRSTAILKILVHANPDNLTSFLTQKLRPARDEAPLLEYLYAERRMDMLDVLSNSLGYRHNLHLLERVDKLIRQLRYNRQSPLPYEEVINPRRYSRETRPLTSSFNIGILHNDIHKSQFSRYEEDSYVDRGFDTRRSQKSESFLEELMKFKSMFGPR